MKRKLGFISLIVVTLVLIVYAGYSYMIGSAQDSIIRIKQVDKNGTLINSPIVLAGKYKHNYKFGNDIYGYQLTSSKGLDGAFTRTNQNVTLRYNSNITGKNAIRQLKQNKYILSMAQKLDTTSLNGIQIQGKHQSIDRLRLFLSDDSLNWERMTLNYPDAQVSDPSVFWNGKKLFVYDKNHAWSTKDFNKWQNIKLTLSSKMKVSNTHVFYDKNAAPLLLVSGKMKGTKNNGLYYARINKKNGLLSKKLTNINMPNGKYSIKSIAYENGKYHMTGLNNGSIKLYTAKNLSNTFKVKKTVSSKKYLYQSPRIVKHKGSFYLLYTLVDRESKSSYGMRHRKISDDWSKIGKEYVNNISVITHDFSVIRIKG